MSGTNFPMFCAEKAVTHLPGADTMLRLIAYDISDPRRWRRICETCEDYGVRVQLSLFECWLDDDAFAGLWERLQGMLDVNEDRLVAYTLDGSSVRKRRTAGQSMRCTEKVVCYIA